MKQQIAYGLISWVLSTVFIMTLIAAVIPNNIKTPTYLEIIAAISVFTIPISIAIALLN